VILGPSNPGLEDVTQDTLLALVHALPGFRRDCGARHFANRSRTVSVAGSGKPICEKCCRGEPRFRWAALSRVMDSYQAIDRSIVPCYRLIINNAVDQW
jgi:hypothetical protein